jgi:hypothetical protein
MFKKGLIRYYFKGLEMSSESCTVRQQDPKTLAVLRDNDEQIVEFVRCGPHWLLKGHSSKNDLLYGSRFLEATND